MQSDLLRKSTREVHVRVAAERRTHIYIDLADADWHAVRVTQRRAGRSCKARRCDPPQRRNAAIAGPGARHIDRRSCGRSSIIGAKDFVLVVAYLLAALRPRGPYPVLRADRRAGHVQKPRLVRTLAEPGRPEHWCRRARCRSAVAICSSPRTTRISRRSKTSRSCPTRCRIIYAGSRPAAGVRTRAMFRDLDETLLEHSAPGLAGGHRQLCHACDLMDRAIILARRTVNRTARPKRALQAEFDRLRPGLFGALLDHLVDGRPAVARHPSRQSAAHGGLRNLGLAGLRARRLRGRPMRPIVRPRSMSLWSMTRSPAACGALMAQQPAWEGTASELLDVLATPRSGPRTRRSCRTNSPGWRPCSAPSGSDVQSPPDQRPARNHDRSAAMTQMTQGFQGCASCVSCRPSAGQSATPCAPPRPRPPAAQVPDRSSADAQLARREGAGGERRYLGCSEAQGARHTARQGSHVPDAERVLPSSSAR